MPYYRIRSIDTNAASIPSGNIISDVASGVSATAQAGVSTTIAAGISSLANGGIAFDASGADWPLLSPTAGGRSVSVVVPPIPLGAASGWTAAQGCLIGPASVTPIFLSLPRPFGNSTINSVTMSYKVAGPHSSAPAVFPKLEVYRFSLAAGAAPTQLWLSSTHAQSPFSGSGSGWDASGNLQNFTYICNQNNTSIDTAQTGYYMTLTDENGASSVSGNEYFGFEVSFNVTDMRLF